MSHQVTHRMKREPRGFALLLVMIIGVACVVIAVGLTSIQGKAREAAIASEDADRARLLAESGMQRAFAYAKERKKTELDFDLVLDPNQDADCSNISSQAFDLRVTGSAPKAGPTTFMPTFSDGSTVQFPPGKNWNLVPDNGGAYLVRFEDNADDFQMNPRWAAASNNTPGIGPCTEGSDTVQATDNPARDRDNGIWVITMGIYPGTDPNTAKHRHVVRRLLSEASTIAGTAFYVKNNLKGSPALLNTKGSVEVGNDIQSGVTACGSVKAGNNNNAVSAGAACGSNTFNGRANQSIATPTTPPQPLDERAAEFYDWTSPCNFYTKKDLGFFYWDPTANGGTCGAYVGPLVPPTQAQATPGGCWVPMILEVPGGAVPFTPYAAVAATEFPGVAPFAPVPCLGWEPDTLAAGVTFVDALGTGAKPDSWYTGGILPPIIRTRPDWSLCGGPTYPASQVEWGLTPPDPNPTGPFETCTGPTTAPDRLDDECNGTQQVLQWCDTGAANQLQFTLGTNAQRAAIPTGVYYVEDDFDHTGSTMNCAPTDATNPIGAFTWPMFTLVVDKKYDQPNNQDTCWGVGTRKGNYASLVVGTDFKDGLGSSSINLAGALWVGANASIEKNLTVFGTVRVDNDFEEKGGGNVRWLYTRDFVNVQAAAQAAPGTRLEFTSGL